MSKIPILGLYFGKGYMVLIRTGHKMEGLVVKANHSRLMSLFSLADNHGKTDRSAFFNEPDFFLMFTDLGTSVFWKNVCSCESLSVPYSMRV